MKKKSADVNFNVGFYDQYGFCLGGKLENLAR